MTSKYSINVFKNLQQYYNRIFNSSNTLPLGRWNLIYDHRMQKRIDRANEDHCGPCGSMYIENNNSTSTNANTPNNNTLSHYERKRTV